MLNDDPLWHQDAIIYQLHVRSFCDRVGDGMGDFRGLTEKLDYLRDLGVSAIWLLPFYPSPLKDDGYDIADYTSVHPDYGTLEDFERFLRAAHQRGLRVITELVLNHTSDRHAWFQRARAAPPGSPERDFYVWSDTPERYQEARIIFQDFESSNWTWDPVAKAYFWHRFYSHQPDLNYDNPLVWEAIFPAVDFWLGMGVDGMRLDAIPYLYEREGTSCENLLETHAFLRQLRRHIDARFKGRILIAEANQWPEDACAYFGRGDEAQMAFHFPVMPRMFMALHMEDCFPLLDILEQTPTIPDNCQWATFLRNHDELTLEMVTDEERDYMYRAYANDPRARINVGIRRRLAPLLRNSRRKIELLNALLFSLPGTPVLYYGDEIGMGDNIYLGDRNGVRTPMQWSADRNAGFSRANPQKLFLPVIIDPEYHYEAINVEAQEGNPSSLLWWMKRLIGLRRRHRAFGRGSLEFLHPANRKVLAFVRRTADERLLVVANLSRFVQHVELDLGPLRGQVPVELFGQTPFPTITERPYPLSLGPHGFYWFALEPVRGNETVTAATAGGVPVLNLGSADWESLLAAPEDAPPPEEMLLACVQRFARRANQETAIRSARIEEAVRMPGPGSATYLSLIRAEDAEEARTYFVPIAHAGPDQAEELLAAAPGNLIARLSGASPGVLHDPLVDPSFLQALLEAMAAGKSFAGKYGSIKAWAAAGLELHDVPADRGSPVSIYSSEPHNTVVRRGEFVFKVFRRLEEGTNPEFELGKFLTDRGFPHAAPVMGAIEYRGRKKQPMTLAVLERHVPNQGDAWQYTLDDLSGFYERAAAWHPEGEALPAPVGSLLDAAAGEFPSPVRSLIDTYLETARLIGRRTAELHLALSSATGDPAFAPEPLSSHYQRSIYQSMRNLSGRVFELLRQRRRELPAEAQEAAVRVLDREDMVLERFRSGIEHRIGAQRIRYHGDYHLGQLLRTGNDFVIIDFEGNPARSVSDRRAKRSPLRDVAAMIRSFHYAAHSVLFGLATPRGKPPGFIRPEDVPMLEPWARFWCHWVSVAFFQAYLEATGEAGFLPHSRPELSALFSALYVEKAVFELGSELQTRIAWARIPLLGILWVLDEEPQPERRNDPSPPETGT